MAKQETIDFVTRIITECFGQKTNKQQIDSVAEKVQKALPKFTNKDSNG